MLTRKRLAVLCTAGVAVAVLAAGAFVSSAGGGGTLEEQKSAVDARIKELRENVRAAKERATVLSSDISDANEQIDVLSQQLAGRQDKLERLEGRLGREEDRLEMLEERLASETELLALQTEQAELADARLEERLVEIYKSGGVDIAGTILLDIGSLSDLVDQLEYLRDLAAHDDEILTGVTEARADTRKARVRTRRTRRAVARANARLAARTEEQRQARDDVAARERDVISAHNDKTALLARVRETQGAAREDIEELAAASERLEREIRAAQRRIAAPASSGSGARPASGFIWPLNGVLTSGYGQRWGRLHAGIDIGVGFGTSIAAVAAGTVVYSGWLGGYGNLVVVDHGNGLSTAYAHQQRIYAARGQNVAQGEALGEVGSTGNSTGPHLHFEVRINGAAVDPLGYL